MFAPSTIQDYRHVLHILLRISLDTVKDRYRMFAPYTSRDRYRMCTPYICRDIYRTGAP